MRFNVIGNVLQSDAAIRDRRRRGTTVASRAAGAGWAPATYSIFVDRAIGLIAFAIIVVREPAVSYNLSATQWRSALLFVDFAALAAELDFCSWPIALALAEAMVGDASLMLP